MKLSWLFGFLASAALVLSGRPGRAEGEQDTFAEEAPPPARAPRTTVLLAPSLLEPFAEITLERRALPWLGFAVVAGAGWSHAKPEGWGFHLAPTYDVGAQVRLHHFLAGRHGVASDIAFGVQGLYGHVRGDEPASPRPFMIPPGVSIAPFISFETILGAGFTFSSDVGVAYYVVTAPWERAPWPGSRVAFFNRLNVGWSFD
jgi:hypothetical protein